MDTSKLYPPFAAKVNALLAACLSRGAEYKITCTVRTPAEQDKIYAQGRPGPDGKVVPGGIISNARGTPPESMHIFGIAADFCRIVNGKAVWDRPSYAVLGEEAKKLGLEWGGLWHFVDIPHVQVPNLRLSSLQAMYAKGGLAEVWHYVDSLGAK